jgi:hypothetical protein
LATKILYTTPAGIAVFPKLNTVDVYQPVDKKGRPSGAEKRRYITNVQFSDEDHRAVDAFLKKTAADLGVADGKLPWKTSKKDGSITLVATSGEKFRPLAVDAKNQKLPADVIIGGGSKIKLNVTVNPYEGFGGGINLYINAVQVLDLHTSAFGSSPFDQAEGYSAPAGREPEEAAVDQNADMENEIPF